MKSISRGQLWRADVSNIQHVKYRLGRGKKSTREASYQETRFAPRLAARARNRWEIDLCIVNGNGNRMRRWRGVRLSR